MEREGLRLVDMEWVHLPEARQVVTMPCPHHSKRGRKRRCSNLPRMPDCRPDHRRRKLGTAVRHKGSHRLAQLLLDSHHRQDLRLRQGSPLLAALVSVHRLALDRRRVDGRCVRS